MSNMQSLVDFLRNNDVETRYITQIIRYFHNEREFSPENYLDLLGNFVKNHGVTNPVEGEIVMLKMFALALQQPEMEMDEGLRLAKEYAKESLQVFGFNAKIEEYSGEQVIRAGSKKAQAQAIFSELFDKDNRKETRKEILTKFEEIGLSKQGAITYFCMFEKNHE